MFPVEAINHFYESSARGSNQHLFSTFIDHHGHDFAALVWETKGFMGLDRTAFGVKD
jgi:hypothetical protein